MKKIYLLLFFLTINHYVWAQPGIGCLRTSDGLLYSQKNIFGFYELVGNKYPTTPPACPRVQLGPKTGAKCQFVAFGVQNDEYNYILLTATGPVQCDLDHYGYGALAIIGLMGICSLRKNKLIISPQLRKRTQTSRHNP